MKSWRLKQWLLWGFIIVVLAACGNTSQPRDSGPVLLAESTLAPTTPAPPRVITSTPETMQIQPTITPTAHTGEILSPLDVATVDADFVLVTPTLPPSKTPTFTPTFTATPTTSPTPTVTVTATATLMLFPTSVIVPVTAAVANPLPQVCDSTWFFIVPRPDGCPRSLPVAGQAVYQAFQNGYMVWIQAQDAIYVMFGDQQQPRWRVIRDEFDEGMAEDDPTFGDPPTEFTWRPRRGFGVLWRNDPAIRERIGWAVEEWEQPFSVQTQMAADGTLFISEPTGGVFAVLPNGIDWARYGSYTGFDAIIPTVPPAVP